MTIITDGGGKNGGAKVSLDQRLDVSSRSNNRSYYNSRDQGNAFIWTSTYSSAAGEEVISIQNTDSSLKLYIETIAVGAINAAVFEIIKVSSGTPAGSVVTGVNLNFGSSRVAPASAFGDASVTGSVTGTSLGWALTPANSSTIIPLDDTIILIQNDTIAVQYKTGTTGISFVSVRGFFDEE